MPLNDQCLTNRLSVHEDSYYDTSIAKNILEEKKEFMIATIWKNKKVHAKCIFERREREQDYNSNNIYKSFKKIENIP